MTTIPKIVPTAMRREWSRCNRIARRAGSPKRSPEGTRSAALLAETSAQYVRSSHPIASTCCPIPAGDTRLGGQETQADTGIEAAPPMRPRPELAEGAEDDRTAH